jgi:hypothetical protein
LLGVLRRWCNPLYWCSRRTAQHQVLRWLATPRPCLASAPRHLAPGQLLMAWTEVAPDTPWSPEHQELLLGLLALTTRSSYPFDFFAALLRSGHHRGIRALIQHGDPTRSTPGEWIDALVLALVAGDVVGWEEDVVVEYVNRVGSRVPSYMLHPIVHRWTWQGAGLSAACGRLAHLVAKLPSLSAPARETVDRFVATLSHAVYQWGMTPIEHFEELEQALRRHDLCGIAQAKCHDAAPSARLL